MLTLHTNPETDSHVHTYENLWLPVDVSFFVSLDYKPLGSIFTRPSNCLQHLVPGPVSLEAAKLGRCDSLLSLSIVYLAN